MISFVEDDGVVVETSGTIESDEQTTGERNSDRYHMLRRKTCRRRAEAPNLGNNVVDETLFQSESIVGGVTRSRTYGVKNVASDRSERAHPHTDVAVVLWARPFHLAPRQNNVQKNVGRTG